MQLHAFWAIQLDGGATRFSTRLYARKGMAIVLDINIILIDPFYFMKRYSSFNKIYFHVVLHKLPPWCWKSNDLRDSRNTLKFAAAFRNYASLLNNSVHSICIDNEQNSNTITIQPLDKLNLHDVPLPLGHAQ